MFSNMRSLTLVSLAALTERTLSTAAFDATRGKLQGPHFIGIEVDAHYGDVALDRLHRHAAWVSVRACELFGLTTQRFELALLPTVALLRLDNLCMKD